MNRLDCRAQLRILRIVERFDEAWRLADPPPLEILLREHEDEDRAELLWQALAIELDYRRRRAEVPTRDEYARRFPEDLEAVRAAFDGEPTVSMPRRESAGSGRLDFMVADPPGASAGFRAEPVGKYEMLGPLGGGGQGKALLARDPALGQLVVLKRHHASREGAADEAKALCRVRSRHTATCLDLFRHEGEQILVMGYIPGRSLSEVLKKGPLVPRVAARLVEQVAEGLEAVHACGLVHRDIKPSNIDVGDDGVPRLVDFGLAAHLGSAALKGISGTPAYMSPEQARDDWVRGDARTDVYGLGAVLYALVTNQPPHPGRTRDESLEHAKQGIVTPPRQLNRSIPADQERVVMKALAADPSQRFATASMMRQALRRCRIRRVYVPTGSVCALVLVAATAYFIVHQRIGGADDGSRLALDQSEQLIKVDRGGHEVALKDVVPLVSGDKLWIECDFPAGWHESAFWLDSEGILSEVSRLSIKKRGSFDRLSYPPPECANNSVTLEGPPGTELILVCARPGPRVERLEVAAMIPPDSSLTPLQDRSEIFIGHDRVKLLNASHSSVQAKVGDPRITRGGGRLQASEAREAEERFQQIANELGRRFPFSAGVVFPHAR